MGNPAEISVFHELAIMTVGLAAIAVVGALLQHRSAVVAHRWWVLAVMIVSTRFVARLSHHVLATSSPTSWLTTLGMLGVLCGGLGLFFRYVMSLAVVLKRVRSLPPSAPSLAREAIGVAHQLTLPCRFQLLSGPIGSMPMTCWLGSWIVVVPDDLTEWPAEQRMTVWVHELGHLARRDLLTDVLMQSLRCLLWPHPLVWFAAYKVRQLREQACDEWSMHYGQIAPSVYARHLRAAVERCQRRTDVFAPTISLAGDRELNCRIRRIERH